MVQVILFVTQALAQTSTTTTTPTAPSVNWGSILTNVVSAVSGIVANPTMAMIGIGVVGIIAFAGYFFFKAKIMAWLEKLAQKQSDQQRQDIIQQQEQQNQADTNIDNQNQQNLNNTP